MDLELSSSSRNKQTKVFTVRIMKSTQRDLMEAARKRGLSLNKFVQWLLKKELKRLGAQK